MDNFIVSSTIFVIINRCTLEVYFLRTLILRFLLSCLLEVQFQITYYKKHNRKANRKNVKILCCNTKS
jgi:hypothetical protein